jgi:hypothetical protein
VSGNYADEGCTAPGVQFWVSGSASRRSHLPQEFPPKEMEAGDEKDDLMLCAVIDAENEEEIWTGIAKHFPDYAPRFCEPKEADYQPGDRFPGFENRTRLAA